MADLSSLGEDEDEAWLDVIGGIKKSIENFKKKIMPSKRS